MTDRHALEAAWRERLSPTPDEVATMQDLVTRIEAACDAALADLGINGVGRVQGSVAKGTWLHGGTDIDMFLLLDPDVPAARLESIASEVAEKVLTDTARKYAQHPYVMGRFDRATVDLVPAYRVAAAHDKMSAVDRTPFHTEWVRTHTDAALRADIRLLKRWLKGVGVYGAETAIGGVSGYLAEVLAVTHGGFDGVIRHFAAATREGDLAPLVVPDPVDDARNCAAAVTARSFDRLVEASRAYLDAPSDAFFDPPAAEARDPRGLAAHLEATDTTFIAWRLTPKTDRLDIVLPQFQRAARQIAAAVEAAGFPVVRSDVFEDPGGDVLLAWIAKAVKLPDTRSHRGPPDDARPNAKRFKQKWTGHEEAVGPVTAGADGRLEVTLRNRFRTAAEWVRANVPTMPLGRHVEDARPGTWILKPLAQGPFAAVASEFILDLRPWQR